MDQMKQFIQLASLLIVVYLFFKRWSRKNPWSTLGVRKGFGNAFRDNWYLIFIAVIVMQIIVPLFLQLLVPNIFTHIIERLPNTPNVVTLVVTIMIATLLEELVFRVFLQTNITRVTNHYLSISVTSGIFALSHWSAATEMGIIVLDLSLVFIDSCLYGLIYHRSRNVFLVWFTHATADLVGLITLTFL